LVLLERDASGEPALVKIDATVATAACWRCGIRSRVLPCDVLPRKTYGLCVIAAEVAAYSRGDRSLRQVAWSQLGDRTPAHTTLHGWTEGLGAHVLERPATTLDGMPFGRVLADAESRESMVRQLTSSEPWVDERRFRSEGRRERLAAVALCFAVALLVTGRSGPESLVELRHRSVSWSDSCTLAFPSRLSCTAMEQVVSPAPAGSRPTQRKGRDRCPTRTRSPPGDSSRSPPS
jgi:hypothetical protein